MVCKRLMYLIVPKLGKLERWWPSMFVVGNREDLETFPENNERKN